MFPLLEPPISGSSGEPVSFCLSDLQHLTVAPGKVVHKAHQDSFWLKEA